MGRGVTYLLLKTIGVGNFNLKLMEVWWVTILKSPVSVDGGPRFPWGFPNPTSPEEMGVDLEIRHCIVAS